MTEIREAFLSRPCSTLCARGASFLWKSLAVNCSGVKFGVLSLLEDCGWCSSAGCLVDLLHVVFITQIYSVVTSQVHVEVCVDFRCVFSVFIGDCYIMAA